MIVEAVTGEGFMGLARYFVYGHVDHPDPHRVAWVESRNLPTNHAEAAARLMRATARRSLRTRKPVYHISISFDVNDRVDRATMRQIADRLLRDLGLQEHQALIVAHRDRAHAHLHIMVNRVHPERCTAWSNSWDYPRIERSLRKLEEAHGLRVVPGRHSRVPGRERAPALVRGGPEFLASVKRAAAPYLAQARSWAELEGGLGGQGLSIHVHNGGFVFTDGVRKVRASEVDRAASRTRLERRLGSLGAYRARQARAARILEERGTRMERTSSPAPAEIREQPTVVAPRAPDAPAALPPIAKATPPPALPRVAPPPPPAPAVPDWLRALVQQGAAIEEAEHRLRAAEEAMEVAEDALTTIRRRTSGAEGAESNLSERLKEVYARPEEARGKIMEHRQLSGDDASAVAAVRADPEQFGPLRAEREPLLKGLVSRRDTRGARSIAPLLSVALDHYYTTAKHAPSDEERKTATERVQEANREWEAAQSARRTLPAAAIKYQQELAELFRACAAEVPGAETRLAHILSTTLPHTARFVGRALDVARAGDHRRTREGSGVDF
jgi:hypothetical protein